MVNVSKTKIFFAFCYLIGDIFKTNKLNFHKFMRKVYYFKSLKLDKCVECKHIRLLTLLLQATINNGLF